MKIETARTSSFTMDYCRFGRGEKTLVILPGLSVQRVLPSADAIAAAYEMLTDDFTIYVFERRNELPVAYSIYDMARDTAKAFMALGLGPVYLFGASQGGMIAMEIAVEYPALVQAMVLGSTSASVGQNQAIESWIQFAKVGKATELYLAFGQALYPQPVFEQAKELLLEAAKTVTEEDLRRFVILAEGTNDFDVVRDLGKIACPVLVIGSKADRVLGGDASLQIAKHVKASSLYMYDGYGHAVFDLAPDYKQRMLQFLAPDSGRLISK